MKFSPNFCWHFVDVVTGSGQCLEGTRFESLSGHRLSWLTSFVDLLNPLRYIPGQYLVWVVSFQIFSDASINLQLDDKHGVPGEKVNILGGHSIGHSKQKMYVYTCSIPNGFRDKAISLYSSKIGDKKEILRLFLIHTGADKSLAFPISYFPICSTTKRFFLDGFKKLEQRSHKCVELRRNM
jgi:hypothetical protein